MRSRFVKKFSAVLLASLFVLMLSNVGVSSAPPPPTPQRPLPNPVLVFMGQESYETGGKQWTRYKYAVENFEIYPPALFVAAPELPPCGANTKAARTWVDLYEQNGKRLNGFCALGSPKDLNQIWFALEAGVIPPSWVYVELNDRKTNTKYKSSLAETTM